MCGRLAIAFNPADLSDELGLEEILLGWEPRYNVAPGQPVLAATDASTRRAEWLRWGLIPSWAKDPAIGNKLINARAETLAVKPSFRNAFQKRRCLIFADGFYEWQKPVSGKGKTQPFYFKRIDGKPFAFAGLWDTWLPGGEVEPLKTCTIITTSANSVVAPVHERMPVILTKDQAWNWVSGNPGVDLQNLLIPFNPELLEAYPVGPHVSNPGYESEACREPVKRLF